MANEATFLETPIKIRRFDCADGNSITKGTLLKLVDPYTVSGVYTSGDAFAGIAFADKVASDGSTSIPCVVEGICDLTCNAGVGITAGAMVVLSGTNLIRAAIAADLLTGAVVGKALETASASEVIKVSVGAD